MDFWGWLGMISTDVINVAIAIQLGTLRAWLMKDNIQCRNLPFIMCKSRFQCWVQKRSCWTHLAELNCQVLLLPTELTKQGQHLWKSSLVSVHCTSVLKRDISKMVDVKARQPRDDKFRNSRPVSWLVWSHSASTPLILAISKPVSSL